MLSRDVTVVDYGVGNLLSVQRALEHCGARVTVTSDADRIRSASHVVLPGVGAFGNAMEALRERQLIEPLQETVSAGHALLGICLGMQLLLDESEEFAVNAGLGLIAGRVVPVPATTTAGTAQKVPHIGWSGLRPSTDAGDWRATVLADVHPGDAMYFVHSFMAQPADPRHLIADCAYGGQSISAVVRKDNVAGCQFHPEKSGEAGLRVLRRFIAA